MGGAHPIRFVRFGSFQLDLRAGELRRNGVKLRVPDQSIQVLAMLLNHPGDVVTRQELHQRLWPNGTIVEFDHSLNAAINRLRQALEDSAEEPRFIETLPRRGYRFILPVEQVASAETAAPSAPEPKTDEFAGQAISHYRILRKLGQGAMGVVYQAEDTRLGRSVAIKFLSEELLDDPQALERFQREAQAASALNHPNICTVHEVGEHEDAPFIVMEYVTGKSLDQLVGAEGLPMNKLLSYAVQVTDALVRAHSAGIVHRDLKPANIMVSQDGLVKLLDFGLAKVRAVEAVAGMTALPTQTTPLTSEGAILGTLQYMSPEQLEGKEADARTDIFALGAVMYEMATGRKAFEGKSQASLIAAIMGSQPPPMAALLAMTPLLDHAVSTCLAKDPEERWQNTRDLATELRWIAEAGGTPGREAVAKRRKRELLYGPLAVICLLAAMAGAALWRQLSRPAAIPDLQLRKLSITPKGLVTSGVGPQAISPDGKYIVYVAESGPPNKHSLSVYELEKGESRELAGTEGAKCPFWSPESNYVGFFADGKLKKVPVQGGPTVTLTTGQGTGTWSTDGSEIVFSDGIHLNAVPSVGGSARVLLQPQPDSVLIYPQFAPIGTGSRALFFVQFQGGSGPAELRAVDGPAQQRSVLPRDSRADHAYNWPVWSPTGHIIYQRRLSLNLSDLWAVSLSPETLATEGDPFPIAENAGYPSVSRDGTLVYRSIATPAQRRLVWVDRDGKRVGEIGEPQWDMSLPTVSPDGRHVAVEGVESSTGEDIWIHDTFRPSKNRLTLDPARDSRPFWSPDGKQIVFWSMRTGKVHAFIQNADGTGNAESIGSGYPTDWSPNGKYLLFDSNWCFRRSDAGSWEKIQTPSQGLAGTLSPDGRFVAFVSGESDRCDVNVQPFPEPSHRWQVSPGGGGQPRWSRDGKELFYVKGDTLFAIPVSTRPGFSFGTPKRLFSDPAFDWGFANPAYDVAPDGRRFVLIDPVGPTRPPAIWIVQNWFAEFRGRKSGRR